MLEYIEMLPSTQWTDRMKEILEQIDSKILPNIEKVWDAHKIRNNVVSY